jgi:hypothetical protein
MLNNADIMKECISIRRGEHPGWKGDRVSNAEAFLFRISYDMPEDAIILADDLDKNVSDYSDLLGIPPVMVNYYANRLREGVNYAAL